jgi:signal transduction histidine kinase
MNKDIQASNASIDYELLSHIAHEARGPFNGLIGFSDLLDSGFESLPVERQKEYIHLVKLLASKSFFQLQTMIAWIKLVSSNFAVHKSPFYLSEPLNSVTQYLGNDINSRSITLTLPHDKSGIIIGDLNYIGIALANILLVILPHTDKETEIAIQSKEEGLETTLSYIFELAHNEEELLSLFGEKPVHVHQIPESKTAAWVAVQILSFHNAYITLQRVFGQTFTLSITFPQNH